jgi:hypothetical protein
MKRILFVGLFLGLIGQAFAADQCLIVRSAEGHRFRNSMIAGALTGGIGFAAGAAFSGAKYEYADSFNLPSTKTKYKGKELEQLQKDGVHVIVVNKKSASAEMDSARSSCKSVVPAVSAVAVAAVPQVNKLVNQQTPSVTPALAAQETLQEAQARGERNTVAAASVADISVADAARLKKHEACLKLAADNSSITCK